MVLIMTHGEQTLETYILAIKPHEELCARINNERVRFAKNYRTDKALCGDYISLVIFKQTVQQLKAITEILKKHAGAIPLLKFELNNYLLIPSHTLCLNLVGKKSTKIIINAVKGLQHFFKKETENKPYFITEPNIVIANRLRRWQYEQAALEYKQEIFRGMFIADTLYLLKRENNGKTVQMAGFSFNKSCREKIQPELF